ncbi:MAG: hypothetical protein QE164_00330 [Candidatus Nezhaarchaeota archaeon]|nr:hypothetical protein [Candidatus Nezhaarchaeota archaeon]
MRLRGPHTNAKALDHRIVEKLLELMEDRGPSWVKRSMKRMYDVYECSGGTWIVRGRRSLGDGETIYVVEYDEERGSFKCTCHQPYKPYAKSRRRACTHVGACLFRHIFF